MELDPLPNPIHRSILHREQSEHRSDSIYFTPTGTPVREVYGSWGAGALSNSLKNTPAKELDPYKAVYAAAPPGIGRRPLPPGVGHRRNKSWSQFLPPLPSWLSSTGRGEAAKISEVEVVIEHDANGDDYYIDVGMDSSPTASKVSDSAAADSLSKSTTGGSIRRSVSVPGDGTSAKNSLTSSSGIVSMGSNSSPQQQQLQHLQQTSSTRNDDEVPLLPLRSTLAQSVTCLLPVSEPSQQKRLSI